MSVGGETEECMSLGPNVRNRDLQPHICRTVESEVRFTTLNSDPGHREIVARRFVEREESLIRYFFDGPSRYQERPPNRFSLMIMSRVFFVTGAGPPG